jgi:hypothetical protein
MWLEDGALTHWEGARSTGFVGFGGAASLPPSDTTGSGATAPVPALMPPAADPILRAATGRSPGAGGAQTLSGRERRSPPEAARAAGAAEEEEEGAAGGAA